MRKRVTNPVSIGQIAFCEIEAFATIGPSDTLVRCNTESLVDVPGVAGVYLHLVSVGGIAVSHICDKMRKKNLIDGRHVPRHLFPYMTNVEPT